MMWPWVSRAWLDSVVAERDFLRSQLAAALDHNRRLDRAEAGLTEAPKEQKPADPVPSKIRKLAEAFGSSMTQQDQLARARRAHAEGMPWEEVEQTMLAALNEGQ